MSADPGTVDIPDRAEPASAGRRTVAAGPVEVRPGLWLLPVEIPIAALQVVNVYAFEHPDGPVTLLDTGWDTARSWRSLTAALQAIGRRPDDVAAVVVTHAHPDHLGLAYRVRAASGAPVHLARREADRLAPSPPMPVRFRSAVRARFPRWGVPAGVLDDLLTATAPSSPASWTVPSRPVDDDTMLDVPGWSLRAVVTPGHTPGHLCLYETGHRLLFTGDHVLPRITPAVGSHPAEAGDPLGDFLDSLARVARLPVRQVLPGHGHRFEDLPGRVGDLVRHHERRLAEVEDVVRAVPGCTAWSVTQRLSWSRPLTRFGGAMIRGAVGETMAHLEHLNRRHRLRLETDGDVERWFPC